MEISVPENAEDLRKGYIHLANRVEELEEALRILRRGRFGASSESLLHPGVRPLFPDLDEEQKKQDPPQNEVDVKAHTKKIRARQWPADLPREDVQIDLPEKDKICSCCSSEMVKVSEKVTEKLHTKPAEMSVKRFIRPVYGCKACETMKCSQMPYHPIPKASVTIETMAHILVSKFVDGLPLNRIEKQFQRQSVGVSRSNMARWVTELGDKYNAAHKTLHSRLLARGAMGMDETTIQVNKEKGRQAHNKSYMLVQGCEGPPGQGIVVFNYEPSRAAATMLPYLEGFKGHLITDGLEVYKSFSAVAGIVHGGCWAHARRKFVEVAKGSRKSSGVAQDIVSLIKKLFDNESRAKDMLLAEKKVYRQIHSAPVIKEIDEVVTEKIGRVPFKSATGKALNYVANQWHHLTRFLDHPELPIHNNFIERCIRPFAVGRKSWLFADTVAGAKASAVFFSLVTTAKLNGINPYDYFCHTLKSLDSSKPEDLLPLKQST